MKSHRILKRARVTSKGQVTVPAEVREYWGVQPGDELRFLVNEQGVRLGRDPEAFRRALDEWRGYLKHLAGTDPDELVEEMRGR